MFITPNDWNIKKFIYFILLIILIIIELAYINIPYAPFIYLKYLVGFIFITLIPGYIILRILHIHEIDALNSLLYAIGLSISFTYFIGLSINAILPLIGIHQPIALLPVLLSMTLFILILLIIAYYVDANYQSKSDLNNKNTEYLKPYILFLILIPLLAIIGASVVNVYHNNIMILIFLVYVCYIILLTAFKIFPKELFPLIIILITIGLMFNQSIISPTIYSSDISIEYYLQYITLKSGMWDITFPHNYNTCISIVLLCPIYSLILSINSTQIFKIIFPLLFSLTPLTLYQTYKYQLGRQRSFIAIIFLLIMPGLVAGMIGHARQEIAELFLSLILLLMSEKQLNKFNRTILTLIFCISLILSHYALAYITIMLFIISYFLLSLIKRYNSNKKIMKYLPVWSKSLTTIPLILILFSVTIMWHINISSGNMFNNIVSIGNGIIEGLFDFFQPGTRENVISSALGMNYFQLPTLLKINKIYLYITEIFVIIGYFYAIIKQNIYKLNIEFFVNITTSIVLLFISIVLPNMSGYFGFERLYHILLFFLAPLFILGAELVWNYIQRVNSLFIKINYAQFVVLFIIVPYFLFSSGFAYEFSNLPTNNIALDYYQKDYYGLHTDVELESAKWLWNNIPDTANIYADANGVLLLNQQSFKKAQYIRKSKSLINGYLFLRPWNTQNNEILLSAYQGVNHIYVYKNIATMKELKKNIDGASLIYIKDDIEILKVN